MQIQTLINRFGRITGFNDVKVNLFGRDIEGLESVEYNDTLDWTNEYGSGPAPVGQNMGDYSASCTVGLFVEEMRAILDSLPPGMSLQTIPPFSITVRYEYNNKIYTDVIRNCRFRTNGLSSSRGTKKHVHTHEILTTHIAWNGIDPVF